MLHVAFYNNLSKQKKHRSIRTIFTPASNVDPKIEEIETYTSVLYFVLSKYSKSPKYSHFMAGVLNVLWMIQTESNHVGYIKSTYKNRSRILALLLNDLYARNCWNWGINFFLKIWCYIIFTLVAEWGFVSVEMQPL